MPEEQEGEVSEAYAWKEMLKLDEMIRSSPIPVNTKLYDKEIFQVCWKPCISAMSYTLESCDLDELRLKSLYGVQKLAYVAAHYRVPSTLDHAVFFFFFSFSSFSSFLFFFFSFFLFFFLLFFNFFFSKKNQITI